ncbi:MAG TPA: signal recognition particle-docking protein FtsY, partial [Alphaproteobacteria bacterium]|nr:signal recognition particle-docking protein FtsY [Alphaproteobacteria bacterium]
SGHHPSVVLMVGVNGAGKTTTVAKFAHQLKGQGKSTLLVAGDTFRAAAVSQLQVWGQRAGVPVLAGEAGADPASLAFKGVEQARQQNADVVLIDTAGRLHNKTDLMAELQKISRVLKKQDDSAPHAVYLVLDATTGQNALSQVEAFSAIIPLTGLVMTKLDGAARGGVLLRVAQASKLPVVAIGVGEGMDDLRPFEARSFARALCGLEEDARSA